ncbi:hypothetical protein HYALB_00012676 [Hymenoscyphus albidus]|uniref:Ran-binding-domain-containing protein n=1 Tax=Hymenoscyphus albidus TaxID=595503 RepID=A0A9N9LSZ9_9HELO|nr:hypothetical protein HYALB_00012676 [Hymenoscyphus albidus]
MDRFLHTITSHAMNYAIRSGIGLTAGFAINQTTRLLKTVEDRDDRKELHSLQLRLDSKIKIISPAIDMIELISARGNTTLESAVTLTKALRWDIQQLGTRLEKAAAAEELSRKKSTRAKTKALHDAEIRNIVKDIRALLARIEDAVPLINLAISTSGASLSATLPNTVSPSRLMQASTLLTHGDWQYSTNPTKATQIGPTLILTLYMLFAGHAPTDQGQDPKEMGPKANTRNGHDEKNMKWKEVIHKAHIRLLRIPLTSASPLLTSTFREGRGPSTVSDQDRASDYAYRIQIIEDLDDDRVHNFDDDELQPGPYEGIALAGIREVIPIHQISKIFYADTGKILNIGNPGETNSPVLLLKRDTNAPLPNRMMDHDESALDLYGDPEELVVPGGVDDEGNDSQDDIDKQIKRESLAVGQNYGHQEDSHTWRFPPDLDPEWFALEVYTEADDFSEDEDELESVADSSPLASKAQSPNEKILTGSLGKFSLSPVPNKNNKVAPTPKRPEYSPTPSPFTGKFADRNASRGDAPNSGVPTTSTPFGQIRSSLSLLEMLIRLTALQQFQQVSHLTIPDQLLVFFLSESSSTGGSDSDHRRQTRYEARRKVGFDPYDESPVKLHGEEYQHQQQTSYPSPSLGRMRFGDFDEHRSTPFEEGDVKSYSRTSTPTWLPPTMDGQRRDTSGPWLQRSSNFPTPLPSVDPSGSVSPYRPSRKSRRPLQRVRGEAMGGKGSPLGRGLSVETDSTLGTSPGTPPIVGKAEQEI